MDGSIHTNGTLSWTGSSQSETVCAEPEEWRPVKGWPYEVSSLGRVRHTGIKVCRRLVPNKLKGYLYVSLWREGTDWTTTVHHLVCEAFHGPRPLGREVRHLDGSRDNNRADNLCWGSPAENQADRVRHGTDHRGEKHSLAKLSDADVQEIREVSSRRGRQGVPQDVLAKRFGVSVPTISMIANSRTWKHTG